jgi:hypothetical protein
MQVTTTLNRASIVKKIKDIQKGLDEEVMGRMEPYIPIDTGTTTADMYMSTVPGEGKIRFLGNRLNPRSLGYNRQYLNAIYKGGRGRFKGHTGPVLYSGYKGGPIHGRATSMWFDAMKRNELPGIKNAISKKFGLKVK